MSAWSTDGTSSYEALQELAPAVVKALLALGKAVDDTGLDKDLTELVKLRVSQLNNCAYCTQLHLNIARRVGVAEDKLSLATAWREAGLFSEREMAALDWAECLTRMFDQPIPKAVLGRLLQHFSEAEVVHLTAAIANINAWNRLAGGLRLAPPLAPAT